MNLQPLLEELALPTPRRENVIEELDRITDPLRAGYPTTEVVDQLFDLFHSLTIFNQWHIQQYAMSCTKYILENSRLTVQEKREVLSRHTDFTKHVASLLSNVKREVREMAAQCIGMLALQVGPVILDEEFGIKPAIFNPSPSFFSLEGQQMALGRLVTAFRINSVDSLAELVPLIINSEPFDIVENPTDNGYVYWYSTRSLLLLVQSTLDPVLSSYENAFRENTPKVISLYKADVIKCAISRIQHKYANVRKAVAAVLTSVFEYGTSNDQEFLESLLPGIETQWIERDGRLMSIAGCLAIINHPLPLSFAQSLHALVRDDIECDKAPMTQKGTAKGRAGLALVQLLRHSPELFETMVKDDVKYLLLSPIAALLDNGLMCLLNLKNFGQFDIDDMLVLAFKNKVHSSFPIRDVSKHLLDIENLVESHYDDVVDTLIKFAEHKDTDIRENVCNAFDLVTKTSMKPLPKRAVNLMVDLANSNDDVVAAAALEVLRSQLTDDLAENLSETIRNVVESDGDVSVANAIKLLKEAIRLNLKGFEEITRVMIPAISWHAMCSFSPVIANVAQEVAVTVAGKNKDIDEALLEEIREADMLSADISEIGPLFESARNNEHAASTFLHYIANFFAEELGGEAPSDIMLEWDNEDADLDELFGQVASSDKSNTIPALVRLMTKADDLSEEQLKKLLQSIADAYQDDSIDEKRPLIFGLDALRHSKHYESIEHLILPDPTPISRTHHQETFSAKAN